ncbi:MAG TPA: hypothetical protein DCE41_17590 [Cytophagales bacterium]|nr:hypothetical protein [Cytophagales bacterium]HAA22162.1 hypothetical protein [Cytophagales bacterium]HAP59000.1 hypothetical protein [Cytophagales bacterium]
MNETDLEYSQSAIDEESEPSRLEVSFSPGLFLASELKTSFVSSMPNWYQNNSNSFATLSSLRYRIKPTLQVGLAFRTVNINATANNSEEFTVFKAYGTIKLRDVRGTVHFPLLPQEDGLFQPHQLYFDLGAGYTFGTESVDITWTDYYYNYPSSESFEHSFQTVTVLAALRYCYMPKPNFGFNIIADFTSGVPVEISRVAQATNPHTKASYELKMSTVSLGAGVSIWLQ